MATQAPAEVLRVARKRIENSKYWCRGAFAKDASLKRVKSTDKSACRWCALGALRQDGSFTVERNLLDRAAGDWTSAVFGDADHNVISVNDGRGSSELQGLTRSQSHRAVLDIYDRAIELARVGEAT